MQGKRKLLKTPAQLKSKNYGELTEREVRIGNHAGGLAESVGHTQYTRVQTHKYRSMHRHSHIYPTHSDTRRCRQVQTQAQENTYAQHTNIHTHLLHTHIIGMHTQDSTTANIPLDLYRCKNRRDTYIHISSHTQACAHASSHTAFLELEFELCIPSLH